MSYQVYFYVVSHSLEIHRDLYQGSAVGFEAMLCWLLFRLTCMMSLVTQKKKKNSGES